VIVLTGRALAENDVRRLSRGVTAVLGKGLFSAEETLAHVTRALRRREQTASETQHIVRRAMAYVHHHYAEPISPGTLATHVGVSKRHLARCFRQQLDISPVTYLNRYRVRQAKALLETSDETVTGVALAVGFSDGHYFGRVFRREVGVSPSAYRKGERAEGTE
jgi:AraC-like DNA-binding protein